MILKPHTHVIGSAGCLKLTFGAGIMKLLDPIDLLSDNGEQALSEIRVFDKKPTIEFPVDDIDWRTNTNSTLCLSDFPFLDPNDDIESIIKSLVIIFKAYEKKSFPSNAYKIFCNYTEPSMQVIDYFLDSWVQKASDHPELIESYKSDAKFVVLEENSMLSDIIKDSGLSFIPGVKNYGSYVFLRTEYIIQRRKTIEAAQHEQEFQRGKTESEESQGKYEESIRVSSFDRFTYLMEDLRNGFIKIGKSTNPERREKTLQSEAPTVELRFAIPADEDMETLLHNEYAEFRQRGEWFKLSPAQIREILDKLLASGDTRRVVSDPKWIGEIFLSRNEDHHLSEDEEN